MSSAADPTTVLSRLQRGLEALYRVETRLDVQAFVVSEEERARTLEDGASSARRPREQLLVSHEGGELAMALYVDADTLRNLERHDPSRGLSEANFQDFCLALEGVSHFIYVALCAAADRAVTALELELQAEVDKFVSCVLVDDGASRPAELRARLFERIRYHDDLDGTERARYATANDEARRYARALERRFLREQRVAEMLAEVRRFYRLPLGEKLGHIARAAA